LPYIGPTWTLPQYTPGCWYQKLAADFREFAALGKKGIIAEGGYPNTTVNISANAPMPAYPITPQGQAAWIGDALRYASNDPNVIGFNYTFPDAIPGVLGPNPPVDIYSLSLFASATTVEPGMLEFNPFIGSTNCHSQCSTLNLSHRADSAVSPDGAPIGYTLAVSNGGANSASSVDLNDPLPAGGGIDWSISPPYNGPGGCTVSGVTGNQVLGCSFGNMAAGATARVHIASSTTSASCQTLGNTALLTADNNIPIQSTANIAVQCVPLAISGPTALPSAALGVPYFATTVTAVGGTGAYTWSAAGLPNGLQIGTSSGTISGIPITMAGSPFAVTVTATDGNGTPVNRTYTLSVLQYSACDLYQTGSPGVRDVQRIVNEVLGVTSAANDLDGNGVVNVTDVQMIVNTALGFGCAAL
jgi:uncharacterized repeat protein (TIGR01451 family)